MALARPIRLTDGQVALRPPELRDVPAIVEACQDPEIGRWTRVPRPYRKEHARAWTEAQPQEAAVSLLVAGADSDELLGSVGLVDVDLRQRRAGPASGRRHGRVGAGVASRGLRLLVQWFFEVLVLARVQAVPCLENEASQRTLERAGFVREGLLRSYEEIKGERWDMAVFSLLAGELGTDTQSRSGP